MAWSIILSSEAWMPKQAADNMCLHLLLWYLCLRYFDSVLQNSPCDSFKTSRSGERTFKSIQILLVVWKKLVQCLRCDKYTCAWREDIVQLLCIWDLNHTMRRWDWMYLFWMYFMDLLYSFSTLDSVIVHLIFETTPSQLIIWLKMEFQLEFVALDWQYNWKITILI